MFIVTVKVELSNAIDMVFRQNYFDGEIQRVVLKCHAIKLQGARVHSTVLYTHSLQE